MGNWTDDIARQDTQVIPALSASAFHAYLQRYRLLWNDVARVAGVPTLVVWSMDHGLTVSSANARRVYAALHALTGTPFPALVGERGQE